jgi:hypothetical protein
VHDSDGQETLELLPEIGCFVRMIDYSMEYTYFVVIATICVVLAMLALVRYVVQKITPRSFRLTAALARVFSFSVEIEAGRHKRQLEPREPPGFPVR